MGQAGGLGVECREGEEERRYGGKTGEGMEVKAKEEGREGRGR